MNIPKISDERIQSMLEVIRPMVLIDGVPHTFQEVDPRRVSFIWDPKDTKPVAGLVWVQTIRTLHTYGHPILFKPSVAEVLAQLPPDLTGVVGFTIEGPADVGDLHAEPEALQAGFHVATVTLWGRE